MPQGTGAACHASHAGHTAAMWVIDAVLDLVLAGLVAVELG